MTVNEGEDDLLRFDPLSDMPEHDPPSGGQLVATLSGAVKTVTRSSIDDGDDEGEEGEFEQQLRETRRKLRETEHDYWKPATDTKDVFHYVGDISKAESRSLRRPISVVKC